MKAELYINKAFMQIKKGDIEGAVCSMKKVIELNDDEVSNVQAHCFLGEYYFVNQNYILAKEHLDYIMEQQEELENEYDDLLNDEIINANVLMELLEKYSLR
ncbi:hypothetical protein EII17_14305 [Clostridiales bacterium COT073_COT-073]|nr:hypothetical protein EII17_14305 [Clostridiales bacterium COT073_COT-073]